MRSLLTTSFEPSKFSLFSTNKCALQLGSEKEVSKTKKKNVRYPCIKIMYCRRHKSLSAELGNELLQQQQNRSKRVATLISDTSLLLKIENGIQYLATTYPCTHGLKLVLGPQICTIAIHSVSGVGETQNHTTMLPGTPASLVPRYLLSTEVACYRYPGTHVPVLAPYHRVLQYCNTGIDQYCYIVAAPLQSQITKIQLLKSLFFPFFLLLFYF